MLQPGRNVLTNDLCFAVYDFAVFFDSYLHAQILDRTCMLESCSVPDGPPRLLALFGQHICPKMLLIRVLGQGSSRTGNVLSITWFDLQYVRIGSEMLFTKVLDQELSRTDDVPSMKTWWHVKQLYAKLPTSSMTYTISCLWICSAQSPHR